MSVTQSMHSSEEQKSPSGDIPATESIWVFILGDMSVFAMFFFLYLYYRNIGMELYQQAQATLNIHYGSMNTLVLLVSSWLLVLALSSLRKTDVRACRHMIAGAFFFGLLFAVFKMIEYHDKLQAGITVDSGEFFIFYYLLTGIHFAHLVCGLGILAYFYISLRPGVEATAEQINNFELSAIYWHMVDLLWILIFPLLYLLP